MCSHCHLSVESTFVVCIQETGLSALLIAVNKNDGATVEALLAGGANANQTSVWSWCLQSLSYHCVFRMPAIGGACIFALWFASQLGQWQWSREVHVVNIVAFVCFCCG